MVINQCSMRGSNPRPLAHKTSALTDWANGTLPFTIRLMVAEGFEPTKHIASDLKSLPFDQTREYYRVPLLKDLILRAGFEPTMSYVNDARNMIKSSFSEKSRSDQDRSNQESKDLHILPKPTSSCQAVPLDHSGIVVYPFDWDATFQV